MAYLKPYDFKQLKAFFLALQGSHFSLERISTTIMMDGVRTPIDKAHCLTLLHSFPDLQGETFKDDHALIRYLSQPGNANRILGKIFTPEEQKEFTETLAEKPMTTEEVSEQPSGQAATGEQGIPAQTPAGSATGTMGIPGIPSATTSYTPRRVIRNIPRAPAEAETITGSGNANKLTVSSGNVGVVGPSLTASSLPSQAQPTETIPPASKVSSQVSRIRLPASFVNTAKNFGSNLGSSAQIGIKKASTRLGSNFSNFLGGFGRAGGGMLGGAAGGGGRLFGNALGVTDRFSSIGTKMTNIKAPSLKGSSKRVLVGVVVSLFFLMILTSAFPGLTPGQSGGGGGGGVEASGLLDYTLPLKDPTIIPLDIKDQVKANFPGAKLEYWDDPIVKRSIAAGWNPALVLALWIEETGASQTTLIKNGGSEIPVNGRLSKGHLGCAPAEDQTINESLDCLFKFGQTNNFTNDQFSLFMAKYSSGPPENPFANNPHFPAGVKDWYSKLVPSGPGAITAVSNLVAATALGCPVTGTITNPYGYNIAGYPANAPENEGCNGFSACHSAIDIGAGVGASVVSPINGNVIQTGDNNDRGPYVIIEDPQTQFKVLIAHLNENIAVKTGNSILRGNSIGTVGTKGEGSTGPHIHYRVYRNGQIVNPLRYLGPSANIGSSALAQSDNISANNYQGISSTNFGTCNTSP